MTASGPEIIKVIVQGPGGVGKSSSTIRFVNDVFTAGYDPTIEEDYRRMMPVDESQVLFDIHDEGYQEDFSALREHKLREYHNVILMYSITDRASFEEAKAFFKLYERLDEDGDWTRFVVLVGNKVDLEERDRDVPTAEGQAFADERGVEFFETSAKRNTNVTEVFEAVARGRREIDAAAASGTGKDKKGKVPCTLM